MKEVDLNKAISITELAKLAPEQFNAWSYFVDGVNEIEYAIEELESKLSILQVRRARAREVQTAAWNTLARTANAAFDLNKSKI